MSNTSFDPGKTAFSRVFLIPGRARPDHEPEYQSCMRAGSVDQSFGDSEDIECPSNEEYGQFRKIGETQGSVERASSSLMGQYAADLASTLLQLAKARCSVDVHVHFGKCSDPRVFNKFTKALVWEDVYLPNYSTDDLGALSSDENAKITETADLTIRTFYEVLQLTFQERAQDVVTNALVDAVICDRIACGDCDEYSLGCEKAFILQGKLTGSPGTPPDVIWTDDKGLNFYSDEITSLAAGETATGIACIGDYVVVVSNDSGSLHWKDKDDILNGVVGGWVEVTTGFVTGGEPNDIWSVGIGAFIVGDGGYVYWTENPSTGVEAVSQGDVVSGNLAAVHALSDTRAVAVGASDVIIYTVNRYTWSQATATGGGNNLTAVWMRNEDEWWVGDDAGDVYYTLDQGQNWTQVSLPGTAQTAINDIQFPTSSVGYIAGAISGPAGMAWRTYNAGNSWVALPEGIGSLPGSSTLFNALATCTDDPNYAIVVGEDALADGVLLVGSD